MEPIQIAEALWSSRSCAEAARRLGVSERTLRRWRARAEVQAVLDDLRQQARTSLLVLQNRAVSALYALLDSPDPQVQLRAVELVLKHLRVEEDSFELW
ncbi:MAG: transposase [Fimbriimonadales bacterium]